MPELTPIMPSMCEISNSTYFVGDERQPISPTSIIILTNGYNNQQSCCSQIQAKQTNYAKQDKTPISLMW